jgi:hypothetical protein
MVEGGQGHSQGTMDKRGDGERSLGKVVPESIRPGAQFTAGRQRQCGLLLKWIGGRLTRKIPWGIRRFLRVTNCTLSDALHTTRGQLVRRGKLTP